MKLSLQDRINALFSGKVKSYENEIKKANREAASEIAKARRNAESKVSKVNKQLTEANELADKARKVLSKGNFTTPYGATVIGKESPSTQRYTGFYTLYSELPGAKQAINKVQDAILAGGFYLTPPEGSTKTYEDNFGFDRIMNEPNPQDTFEDVLRNTIMNMKVFGNAYWEIGRYQKGDSVDKSQVAAIWCLPAQNMSILVDETEYMRGNLKPVGYVRNVEQMGMIKKVYYEIDDIIHFKVDNPDGGLYGESVFQTNRSAMELVLSALAWNRAFFDNNAKPDFEISLPETANSNDALSYSKYFEANFKGATNHGKTLIHYGGAQSKDLGSNPKEVDFLELIKYFTKLIVDNIGAPISMLGIMEDVNRASAEVERRTWLAERIEPLQNYLKAKIDKELIKKYFKEDDRVFEFGELDLITDEQKAAFIKPMVDDAILNRNEGRRILGYDDIQEAWANEYSILTTMGPQQMSTSVQDQLTPKGYFYDYKAKDKTTKKLSRGKAKKD